MTESTGVQKISWVRALAAALTAPAVAAVAALALLAAWSADLPERLAVHFGPGGDADRFATLAAVCWSVLLGPAIAAVLVTVVVPVTGRDPRAARTGAAVAAGTGVFVAVLPALVAIPQHGVSDAASVAVPVGWIAVGAVAALLSAVLAYRAVPAPGPTPAVAPPPEGAPRLPLADGERVAWSGSAAMPRLLGAIVVAVPLTVVLGLAVAGVGSAALLLVITAISAALMAFVLAPVRVLVDHRGLTARSVVAIRPIRIPIEEVAEAREVSVALLNGFGGYGYRVGPAGVGLIVRPGPALQVARGDGSRFTVTVDGADRAAAVLNALAARDRSPR
ncbi:hypothetical protein GCM10023094_44700 [Rhodococcus olei]|uniref:DUF1648 domain-containing protein n=1 Tax=Rhodococcus olei TaxID=2161675 RepID=A0ABP8PJJ4_9NOCA